MLRLVAVGCAVLVVTTASVGPAVAHETPGFETPMLYVSAELVKLEIHIPAAPGEDVDDAADGIYGDEDPDYLVLLVFTHENHPEEGPPTWQGYAIANNIEDPEAWFPGDEYSPDQVLYDAEEGINRFDEWEQGRESKDDRDEGKTPWERFLLAGPDGYDHVQCAPRQDMTVRVVVVDLDDDSWGPTVIGQLVGAAAGVGVQTLAGAAIGGPVGAGVGFVGGATASWATSAGTVNGIEYFDEDEVVAQGAGQLKPNGITEIPLVHRAWREGVVPADGRSSAYPRLGEEVVVDPGSSVVSPGHRLGTVVDGDFRDEPGSPRDGESVTQRVLVEEDRGTATFRTTTFPVDGVFDRFVNAETLVRGQQRQHVCAHWESHGAPPSYDQQSFDYHHSTDAMVALAAALHDEHVPVEAVPGPLRGLVADQRANVNVGTATMGVETGADGQVASLTAGPLEDPRVEVTMSPETAYEIVHAEDRGAVALAKLDAGEVTYRGVGWGDRLAVGALRVAAAGYRGYDHLAVRVRSILPSKYDVDPGTATEIRHGGTRATLYRNHLGVRTVDTGGPFASVVTGTGEPFGATTMGAQRLVDAPVPGGWEPLSGPAAGVYARQATQARQGRATGAAVSGVDT